MSNQPNVHLYILTRCPFCIAAKQLLNEKKVEFSETVVDNQPEKWREMVEKSNGGNTAPQIFINGQCLGGFSELKQLDDSGQLDTLLIQS